MLLDGDVYEFPGCWSYAALVVGFSFSEGGEDGCDVSFNLLEECCSGDVLWVFGEVE